MPLFDSPGDRTTDWLLSDRIQIQITHMDIPNPSWVAKDYLL